ARDPVAAACGEAGVGDVLPLTDAVDAVLRSCLAEGFALAGPDVGSPVLRIGNAARGFHGPILRERVLGARAVQVFDALVALQGEDAFYEIKRGRTGGPLLGDEEMATATARSGPRAA